MSSKSPSSSYRNLLPPDSGVPNTPYDQQYKCVSSLIDKFFNGQPSALLSQQTLDIFTNLINHHYQKSQNNYPSDSNSAFHSFCETKKNITISLDLLYGDYACLSQHFISNKNIILLSNIIQLFTKCTSITILACNRIQLSAQYISEFMRENELIWNGNNTLKEIIFTDIRSDGAFNQKTYKHKYAIKYNNNNTLSLTKLDQSIIKSTAQLSEISKHVQGKLATLLLCGDRESEYKTPTDLLTECTNCVSNDKQVDVYHNCESIKRVNVILPAYTKMLKLGLCEQASFMKIFTFREIYTLTEITNDFYHIKDHFDDKSKNINENAELHRQFREQFGWKYLHKYPGFRRQRENIAYSESMNDEDIDFRHLFDKMCSYLTGFQDPEADPQNGNKNGKVYIGKNDDEIWWNNNIDYEIDNKESDDMIYRKLVENMGIFRWQCSHGFTNKQNHSLMHLKPKYANVKEEVLYNPYYALSKDNWNQNLRKGMVFEKSFAKQRIKTSYAGTYDDKIAQQSPKWNKGETINYMEIVIFKLYTDFDKLQFELKKCFRFETISDIFTLNNFHPDAAGKYSSYLNDENDIVILEERLRTFYGWRIKLLTVLHKFAQELDPNVPLYHGVNGKMILNSGRNSAAFHGPLSTTSSYHVARTFASGKGMVLEVTSQFPRLGYCKAFDASIISDYPEENEWIISFVYLRIKNVKTRAFHNNRKSIEKIDNGYPDDNVPLSSQTRSIFFAVHLFRQGIFSMAVHLEYWLCGFLYLHCNYVSCKTNDNGRIKKTKFVETLQKIDEYDHEIRENEEVDDKHKSNKILSVLRDKFENFRKYPNQKQIIKIDQISDNIRPYFMDYTGLDLYKKAKYVISFQKIVKIYENVTEIHFINDYIFDDAILNNLVQYLFKNPVVKIKQIKFLYYDYDEYKFNSIFYNIAKLAQGLLDRLKKMNWNIEDKLHGKTSYEIRIFFNAQDKKTQKKKHLKKNKKIKNEKTEYHDELTTYKVPRAVTNALITGIKHKIPNDDDEKMENDNEHAVAYIHSYIIKVSSLHINNEVIDRYGDRIKIFNYDLHDITTNKTLYFVAKPIDNPKTERGFKWKFFDKIFNAQDIENEFGISNDRLPALWKIRPCFAKQLHRKIRVINLIKNQKYIQRLIKETPWHKKNEMPIYNKHENRRRITYSIEKQDFMYELSEFMKNNRNNVNLTPVLIRNKNDGGHHVEFMQIVSIRVKQKQEKFNIALSYQHIYDGQNSIKIVGIYLDKYFISSQHQLISDCRECKCFDDFISNIDHLTIGNPDYFENNMNRYKEQNKQLKKQAKESNANNDDCKYDKPPPQQNKSKRKKKSKQSKRVVPVNNQQDKPKPISTKLNQHAPAFIPYNNRKASKSNLDSIPEATESVRIKLDELPSIVKDELVQEHKHEIDVEVEMKSEQCSNCPILKENLKIQTDMNNFYFQQTLNPIQKHPMHDLSTPTRILLQIPTIPKTPPPLQMSTTDPILLELNDDDDTMTMID